MVSPALDAERLSGSGLQGMRAWALTVVARRLRLGWGLPVVVTVIAVLSCTLLSALVLMVQNAEQVGVRASLAGLSEADSRIDISLDRPSVTLAEARAAVDGSVQAALGGAATSSRAAVAVSDFEAVSVFDSDLLAYAYFTAPDGLAPGAELLSGEWPAPGEAVSEAGHLAVAVPEQAAAQHGLAVGSTFAVGTGSASSVTADVVAIYRADATADPAAGLWATDALQGAGDVRDFPRPGVTFFDPIEAIGPLLATPDALDAARVPMQSFDLTYRPDFLNTDTSLLTGLSDRLSDSDLTAAIGDTAAQVSVETGLPAALGQISTALTVTRSTVVIVAILLTLLAVAALGQAARLFAVSRVEDGVLAKARGASARQLFGVASIEATLIGLLAAIAGPILAFLALRGVWPSTPVWLFSAVLALVFVAVLLAPLLGPQPTAADAPRMRARPTRASGLARSGLDLGIVVVAAVLYAQLLHYRSPLRGVGTLALDPILVAGPAVVLLAGALLATRVVPLIAHQLERLASRTSGMIGALTAWEIARRTQSLTSVVLLLTLSLAVGTFSQSYLATWNRSQADQAALAVGAPVVVAAAGSTQAGSTQPGGTQPGGTQPGSGAVGQAAQLEEGASGVAPVIRRPGRVSASPASRFEGELPSGPAATVLALSGGARGMLAEGRNGELGGNTIDSRLGSRPEAASGMDLPAGARGLSATVSVAATRALPAVAVGVRAMVEDADGLLTVLDLGSVAPDGTPQPVEGRLPGADTGEVFRSPARLVGVQTVFVSTDSQGGGASGGGASDSGAEDAGGSAAPIADAPPVGATVTFSTLAALVPTTDPGVLGAESLPATSPGWRVLSNVPAAEAPTVVTAPGSVVLGITVPGAVTSAGSTFSAVGWPAADGVPAVITDTLARTLGVGPGAGLAVVVGSAVLAVRVTATVPYAPGASGGALLTEIGPSATATGPPAVIVVDEQLLSRALAESGQQGALVDEWWVDVAADRSAAYTAAHPAPVGAAPTRSIRGLTDSLTTGPLRAALPDALVLAVIAGGLLGVVGFVLHTAGSLRARRSEFAHLRAIGVSRRQIVALIGTESALLALLGVVLGVGLGIGLSLLVALLIGVSPNGAPPLPEALIVLPAPQIAALVAAVLVVVTAVVLPLSAFARSLDPARILRGGS